MMVCLSCVAVACHISAAASVEIMTSDDEEM
jgi:hypothetical protein